MHQGPCCPNKASVPNGDLGIALALAIASIPNGDLGIALALAIASIPNGDLGYDQPLKTGQHGIARM